MLNLQFPIKKNKLLVLLLPLLIGASCKKDNNEQKCYQVQYHVKDKVFYVKYHYDKDKEKELSKNICPAIFSPVKILIGDYTSVNGSENP